MPGFPLSGISWLLSRVNVTLPRILGGWSTRKQDRTFTYFIWPRNTGFLRKKNIKYFLFYCIKGEHLSNWMLQNNPLLAAVIMTSVRRRSGWMDGTNNIVFKHRRPLFISCFQSRVKISNHGCNHSVILSNCWQQKSSNHNQLISSYFSNSLR